MAEAPSPSSVSTDRSRNLSWLAGLVLVLAAVVVYANSLGAPFVFDDLPAIVRNLTIRQLNWEALRPPVDGAGVAGRPLVNLSLALNYAMGGLDVRGYHAVNLALHILTTLALWGVLRRTLAGLPAWSDRAGGAAFGAALLWTVHPLLTESVICVVQRNEVMGALFCLLTLHGFIRGTTGSSRWLAVSVLACLAGVASKETVATAPLLVLLYDRTFVAGTFRAAWERRRGYYLALAATWLPLAWLVWSAQQRGGAAGFGLGVSPWAYLLTQCRALGLYLQLSFWPHPLVTDYGWPVAKGLREVWWQGLAILVLLAATIVALRRRPAAGFLGAGFFLLLAPSSSVVPLTTQTIAEHRMYLPLAFVVTAVVLGLTALGGRRALAVVAVVAAILGALTIRRGRDYRSAVVLWTDTIAHASANPRAHGNLGVAYLTLGRWEDALAPCREQMRLDPEQDVDGHVGVGCALMGLGRPAEALPYFVEALRRQPDDFAAHNNHGAALAALNRWPEAVREFESARRVRAEDATLRRNLAEALMKTGQLSAALEHFAAAVRLEPDFAEAEAGWGRALAGAGRSSEALPHFEAVLRLRPDAAAHTDVAVTLAALGRVAEALPHMEEAARLQPQSAGQQYLLAVALDQLGRRPEAERHDEEALRLRPDFTEARAHLERLRQR